MTRRLTRKDRIRIARAINGVPSNSIPGSLVAFGRGPFPLRGNNGPVQMFPRLHVNAWIGSPAWRSKYESMGLRLLRLVEPVLWAVMLVSVVLLVIYLDRIAQALGL